MPATRRLSLSTTLLAPNFGQELSEELGRNATICDIDLRIQNHILRRNRVTSENSEGAFAPGSGQCTGGLTHSYGYDLAGNRVVAQYAGDTVPINYSYDAENRLSGIAENGRATAYGYDLVGDVTLKTLPNGDVETMSYDAMRRMTSESGTSGAGVAQYGYAYTHDLAGNLYSIQESSLGAYNQYQSFSYDGANRLTDETSTAFGPKHYSYDGANNRTSFTDPATGAVVSCSYNALNQIVSLTENGSGAKSVTFGYDLNGNRVTRTSGGTTNQYSYDGENRLWGIIWVLHYLFRDRSYYR